MSYGPALNCGPCEAVSISFAGATVTALLELDRIEHHRRRRLEAGPVLDRNLLETLGELPHGISVGWAGIDPVKRALLDTAPLGTVCTNRSGVRRVWRPAVRLRAVTRRTGRWQRDIDAVSRFAPDAPRYLIVGRRPEAGHPLVEQARWLGVGLVLASTGESLLPAEDLPVAATPRHWRLLETVYEAWLRARCDAVTADSA